MAFMQHQVEHGVWITGDTDQGGFVIQGDLVDLNAIKLLIQHLNDNDILDIDETPLRDYIEGNHLHALEIKTGYGARLSAPGYLDCTEWDFFETEDEAEEHLDETYGEEEEEEEDLEENPEEEDDEFDDDEEN